MPIDQELQMKLIDILGFDHLDLVTDILTHRAEILKPQVSSETSQPSGLLTRKQREAALRQQDYEHKHMKLGPKLDRDEPDYPHVYKTYNAGNTLSYAGRKFGLPFGSQRLEFPVSALICVPISFLLILIEIRRIQHSGREDWNFSKGAGAASDLILGQALSRDFSWL
jgi:antiviral helicase SLH1